LYHLITYTDPAMSGSGIGNAVGLAMSASQDGMTEGVDAVALDMFPNLPGRVQVRSSDNSSAFDRRSKFEDFLAFKEDNQGRSKADLL